MLDTSQYERRRDDGDAPSPQGILPGRHAGRDRRAKPAELLDQVEADLRSTSVFLRFRRGFELAFQKGRERARLRHYVIVALIGIPTFDLFLVPVALTVPDVLPLARVIALCFFTPVALFVIYLVHRKTIPPESIVFNLFMAYGIALWVSRVSYARDAVFFLFTLPIFVIFSNIALPLPFAFAAFYTGLCTAAVTLAVSTDTRLDLGVRILMVLVEISIGAYTLLATHRMEQGERRAFLLTLRETLRGEALTEQNRELSELSDTDGLTGIPNRRVFDRTLDQLWNEHLQSRTPLALLMIDIDHFKKLNDTHGHNNGDLCLRKTADRLRRLMRPHQSLARYGGEEFAVLLEGEGAFQADIVAERLRAEIEAMPVVLAGMENKPHHVTISIGCVTAIPRAGLSSAELFLAADQALYTAKREGRNRVCTQSLGFGHPLAHSSEESSVPPDLTFNLLANN